MFAELPLSTNTLLVVKSAIDKVMTIASSCGWWILLASSSMNVMAYSFMVLVLGDLPKSWTFCTTFRYVFLDLEDCPVEVPPMMALPTFPSTSHLYNLVKGSFSTSLAWWDFLSIASNQNTRAYHAHGLCESGNTYSFCACWYLPSFFRATSRKDHPWFA